MLAIVFLLIALGAGSAIAYAIPSKLGRGRKALRLEDRVFMSVPLGLAAASILTFLAALVFGLNEITIALTGAVATVGGSELWRRPAQRRRLRDEWRDFRERARKPRLGTIGAWLVFAALGVMLGWIYWHSLFLQDGNLYVAFGNVWGDWNQHIAQTSSFVYGDNLPPQLNYLSGQKITYPFMTNFLSAILNKSGFDLLWAMKVPGVLLTVSGLGLLGTLTRLLIGRAIWLVPILFYFSGGLGFINFIDDLMRSHQSLGTFLAHLPHNYTQTFGSVLVPNINWINTIYAYLIPQRAFLFGMPLLLTAASLLYLGLAGRNWRLMLSAGMVASLLPLIHTHSLIFLGMFSIPLVFLTRRSLAGRLRFRWTKPGSWLGRGWKLWLAFFGPILAVGVPQVLWLSYGVQSSRFFRVQYGWTKHTDDLFWFWLKNAGLFIPLILIALRKYRDREPLLVAFTLSAGFVWVLANLFVFQPWDWDNTKLLVYWFVISLPIVALLLASWADRGKLAKAGVTLIVLSLTLAGAADVSRTLQPASYKVLLFDPTGLEIGRAVAERTEPNSVWLTSQLVNNPVSVIGGRRVVLGYTGNLWSYGLPYADREADVRTMYAGGPDADRLLAKYHVSYVVIGTAETNDQGLKVNEPYFGGRYPVWDRFGPVTVYDVRAPKPPGGA
jgi:hypothetical protein